MDSSMTIIFPDFDRRNSWDLVVVPEGTPLEEGTIINCAEPYYRYSGLLPNSKYVLYVRANCVFNKAKSFWSDPLYFTTPYPIASFPFLTIFAS